VRALVMSDLQFDDPRKGKDFPPVGDVDVVVVAGDLYPGLARSLETLANACGDVPSVYVAGNRDFYGGEYHEVLGHGRERAKELGVHFLENDEVVIAGTRIFGCTLWTDYGLAGPGFGGVDAAGALLADHQMIRWIDGKSLRGFTTGDALGLHKASVARISEVLARSEEPVMVVSHHAPHPSSIRPSHAGDPLSAAFASDLGHLMEGDRAPVAWLHGATHHPVDYTVGRTRVVSNPLGYADEDLGFKEDLVLEVESRDMSPVPGA
jgi:hypothetical protein